MSDGLVNPTSKGMLWAGRVLSALPALLLLFSGTMKFTDNPDVAKGFSEWSGSPGIAKVIGGIEIASTVIYLIPQTAVLGAILLTGYMGGAIATHVRMGDAVYLHIVIGVVIWLGIFLRDARLRAILPLRR
jgi:hypothetical protein